MKYITSIGDQEFEIEILNSDQVSVDGKVYSVDFEPVSGQPVFSLLVDGGSYQAYIFPGDQAQLEILLRGTLYSVTVEDEREKRLKSATGSKVANTGEFVLKSPMPGLVVEVPIAEGDEILEGDVMVILESMKMQNELKAPHDGTVSQLMITAGDRVEQNQSLAKLKALDN